MAKTLTNTDTEVDSVRDDTIPSVAMLVTVLVHINDCSLTEDQLINAPNLFVVAGFRSQLGKDAKFWDMAPVRPWYHQYAVANMTTLAPTRLILREDWGTAERRQAINADARGLLEKMDYTRKHMTIGKNLDAAA